ncbi:MurR/RpiR family transcriptional regulator [Rhodococcus sp. 114MFTsu3.1]|uniref:MurR/RpiR family transcriptional regulator n=1 Tax=Rhodococcus sp. 114MFTsu3.1 TaxID=1172184 RepID=UPI001E5A0712|nr:MurR/RpiR family transcriptional regulator [Rhodococcus sp. 114MFTsu3.1]
MLTPGVGSTVLLIRTALPGLGPRERAVAEAIVRDPRKVSGMGAAELGAYAGTSAATVTRACQSLGFDGFPHLRTLLVRDEGAAAQAGRTGKAYEHALHRLFAEAARELDSAPTTVDLSAFGRAVTLVGGARRIVLIGAGGSAATVLSIALRFMSTGISVEAPNEPALQLLTCRLLEPGDVVLAVSDSGENVSTLPCAEAAMGGGAKVIAVSSFPRSTLARLADEQLIIGASGRPWPESVLTSNLLQSFLLNALVAEVAKARQVGDKADAVYDDIVRVVTGNRRPGSPSADSSGVNL